MKKALLAIMAITLLCFGLTGCGDKNSPVDTVNAFMDHYARCDYEDAYDMLSESSQEQLSLEEFSRGPESIEESEEQEEVFKKIRYELAEESEDEALVYVTHADYPLSYQTVSLVKEDNTWKIDFYGSSLLAAAKESVDEKTCQANMRYIESACNIYGASNEGVYPTSWDDLVPDYIDGEEHSPFCPLDGCEYIIVWNSDSLPEIECPNHGPVYWTDGDPFE